MSANKLIPAGFLLVLVFCAATGLAASTPVGASRPVAGGGTDGFENCIRVIYGDTDSVMINTNVDNIQDALKLGNEFKKEVNDSYRLLEIDIDNVFRRILLHAKKKYAAINMVPVDGKYIEKLEVKGLDMRRREYCALSKETST